MSHGRWFKGVKHWFTPDFHELLFKQGGNCLHHVDSVLAGHVVALLEKRLDMFVCSSSEMELIMLLVAFKKIGSNC